MIRDITIGQYYNEDSIIHRLDPRVKMIGTLVYLVSLFLVKNLVGYIVAFSFLAIIILLSKVPIRFITRGLKAILFLIILTTIFNLFLTEGTTLVHVWKIRITDNGLRNGIYMIFRLLFLIMGAQVMSLTTTPNSLTCAIESLLKPLKVIRVPVSELAMMMSIALRFIPILLEETNKIMNAQKARGANFEEGSLIQKAKALIPVLVPLFVSAFKRADELSFAMEARCYVVGGKRTKLNPLIYKRRDIIAFIVFALYITGIVLVGKFITYKIWIF